MLKDQIMADLKEAMKNKDTVVLSTLRMLKTAIMNKEISMRSGDEVNLSDDEVLAVISSEVKKRHDSVTSYQEGGREDLASQELAEIKVLQKYLPAQISDEDLEKVIKVTISELGEVSTKDFGRIMGQVIPKVKGQADGKRITEMVKKLLG